MKQGRDEVMEFLTKSMDIWEAPCGCSVTREVSWGGREYVFAARCAEHGGGDGWVGFEDPSKAARWLGISLDAAQHRACCRARALICDFLEYARARGWAREECPLGKGKAALFDPVPEPEDEEILALSDWDLQALASAQGAILLVFTGPGHDFLFEDRRAARAAWRALKQRPRLATRFHLVAEAYRRAYRAIRHREDAEYLLAEARALEAEAARLAAEAGVALVIEEEEEAQVG